MRTHTHEAPGQTSSRGARYSVLVMATAVVFFVICADAKPQTSATGTQAESSGGNAQKGKQLYTDYGCYECHGREGQGSKTSGPRLGPSPISFFAFAKYIRQPKGQMPPYTTKVASDAELSDIYAFLKSLPAPPAVKSIPLLK